ncbi:MAG: cupin domain-containing protein [Solirubrobacteraceae bacterium]|nr:cupin domain-containing protein [Solirubrobacteraceae bacterium]
MTLDPVHVPADGGDTVWLVGDTYTTILTGEQTGGAFTLLEALVPPETGPPPHWHLAEDETFIVLDGTLDFRLGDEVIATTAGTTVFVPRGVEHSFTNTGTAPARMLFIYSPPGMEGMFAEIGTPGQRGVVGPPLSEADVTAMIGVASKYRFEMPPPPA